MTQGIYEQHRDSQREWILKVAQDLFIEKGIEKTSISNIAKSARLTRATLYNYFTSKEEMAHEIFKLITVRWSERQQREVWDIPGTGFERVDRFVSSHINYLVNNLEEARFVAEFNHLYAKEWSVETIQQLLDETLEGERARLIGSIQQGQEDGTIRTDIASDLMIVLIFNFINGMTGRLGEFGDKLELEFKFSTQTIMSNICRVFLDGLKPSPLSD